MTIERLGERALLLRDLNRPAYVVAEAIRTAAIVGVEEAVASYDTVAVYLDRDEVDESALATAALAPVPLPAVGRHTIPVCYERGEDLEAVAADRGLSADEVVALHSGAEYRCDAVGFCPGFPYLSGLPGALCGVPRLASPRPRVPAGAVAITGRQAGVYPLVRPGGWRIVGLTPLTLVDVDAGYFPIAAGDEVRFAPISPAEFEARLGERL